MNNNRALLSFFALIIIIGYVIELYAIFKINNYPCEDAFITFRFSRNLAEGAGPVFNPGEHVEGYSNFIWMTAIAGAHKLGLDMASFSRFIGGLCNILTLLLIWYIPCRYFAIRGYGTLFAPLLYVLFLPFHYLATNGLETSAYTFLLLLCTHNVLWAQNRPLPFALSSFGFLLLALTRPEGNLFFAFYIAYIVLRCLFNRESLKPYLPGFFIFIAGYSLFVLWRLSYYHLPLPNTYYAKTASFPLIVRAGLGVFTLKGFLTHYPYLVIFLLMFWKAEKLAAEKHAVVPVILFIACGLCFNIFFVGFEWVPFFRHITPLIPLVLILCQLIVCSLWNSVVCSQSKRQRLIWGSTIVFCFVMAGEQFFFDLTLNLRLRDLDSFAYYNQKTFGDWVKKELADKYLLCLGDIGRIPYYSETPTLDLFGLTSREFAELRKTYGAPDITWLPCSFSFNSYKEKERALLLKLKPEYVMLYNFQLKGSDTYPGSSVGIADHADFKERYAYLGTFNIIPKTTSPSWPKPYNFFDVLDLSSGIFAWIYNGWGYDIYVRKDSPGKRFRFELYPDDRIKNIITY